MLKRQQPDSALEEFSIVRLGGALGSEDAQENIRVLHFMNGTTVSEKGEATVRRGEGFPGEMLPGQNWDSL